MEYILRHNRLTSFFVRKTGTPSFVRYTIDPHKEGP